MPRLNSSYPTMSHIAIDASGMENLPRHLHPPKATGPGAMPAHLLCELSAEVAPASTLVFQMPLDAGQLPDDRRMAYILPVYKRGDKCSAENYRHVHVASSCSKVMEHILFSNIIQHLDKKLFFDGRPTRIPQRALMRNSANYHN